MRKQRRQLQNNIIIINPSTSATTTDGSDSYYLKLFPKEQQFMQSEAAKKEERIEIARQVLIPPTVHHNDNQYNDDDDNGDYLPDASLYSNSIISTFDLNNNNFLNSKNKHNSSENYNNASLHAQHYNLPQHKTMPWPFAPNNSTYRRIESSVLNQHHSSQFVSADSKTPTTTPTTSFFTLSSSDNNAAALYDNDDDDDDTHTWSVSSSWLTAANNASGGSSAIVNVDMLQPPHATTYYSLLSPPFLYANFSTTEESPTTTSADDLYNTEGVVPYDWAHAPVQVVIFIGFLLCLLTALTVLGNVYVITAVMIVRRLRRPDNLLIVSLATADLLVGLIDMPFAVVYQLKGRWIFNKIVCDLWISFDVLVCTASILNLCMISIDRYLAISRPLHYGIQGRTKRKMALYIVCVWCLSILISIPPLFFFGGNEYIEDKKCGYSPSIAYQLYATLAAFYIPLFTTLIVYGQVYRLASRVARAERRSLGTMTQTTHHFDPASVNSTNLQRTQHWLTRLFNARPPFTSQSSTFSVSPTSISPTESHASSTIVIRSTTLVTSITPTDCGNGFLAVQPTHHHHISVSNSNVVGSHKFIKRERKAMRTLSAITAAFVMCWLPFFILALLAPLCSACKIPNWLSDVTLWLGYCNSCINPFLYAYFNRDFRTPFRAIACCQCHRLHDELRTEQFRAQYGSNANTTGNAATVRCDSVQMDEQQQRSASRNSSRYGSANKQQRSSSRDVGALGSATSGSFRHQRYVDYKSGSNSIELRGGQPNGRLPSNGEVTMGGLAHRSVSSNRSSLLVEPVMEGVSQKLLLEVSPVERCGENNNQRNGSSGSVTHFLKPLSTTTDFDQVFTEEDKKEKEPKKRRSSKSRQQQTTCCDSGTNTDITGVMIESFIVKKLQQQTTGEKGSVGEQALLNEHGITDKRKLSIIISSQRIEPLCLDVYKDEIL